MIRRTFVRFTELPSIMRMGLLILALGGALDVFYHAAPLGWAIWLDGYLGRHAAGAHLVTLLGMIATLLGLFMHQASIYAAPVEVTQLEGRQSIER